MKGIVIGNSQAGALREAAGKTDKFDFYSIPGGNGPNLIRKNKRFFPANSGVTIFSAPSHLSNEGINLENYDYIIYSGFGLSAPRNQNRNHLLNQLVLAELAQEVFYTQQSVSRAFMASAIRITLESMPVTWTLKAICRVFSGKILVQPFPLPTASVFARTDNNLLKNYGDKKNEFLSWYFAEQYFSMCEIIKQMPNNAVLLEYPNSEWLEKGFTPDEFSRGGDCWHMNAMYGELVLQQVLSMLHF